MGHWTDCIFLWAGLAAMVTMKIDSFATRDAVVSFVVTPLSFSAPAFYVWKEAPAFIRYIAICNPLTYQLEVLREVAFDTLSKPSFFWYVCLVWYLLLWPHGWYLMRR